MDQVTITLSDNATVSLTAFPADTASASIATILCLPAMGVRANFYQPLAKVIQEANINCVVTDLRGLGTSSVRPSSTVDFGYKEMISDLDTVIQEVKTLFPKQPLFLLGHSLGAQVSSLYLGKNPKGAEGLVLVAGCSVYYKGWTGSKRWTTLMGVLAFPLISRLVGYFPGNKIGFGGEGAKTALIDWGYVGRTGQYNISNDDFDYEKAMKQTSIPIFAASIEDDWMAPKLAIQNLYKKFYKRSPVTTFELTQAATGVRLNHFNWVKHSSYLVKTIKIWITTISRR